jgi:hypothetical protein
MTAGRQARVLGPLLLGAVCAGLAGVLYNEFRALGEARFEGPSSNGETPAVAPLPPDPIFALPPAEDFAAIVERPVFSPSRRPLAAPAPVIDQGGDFVLVGIVISDGKPFALVRPQPGAPPVRVDEGGSIAGWTAEAILADMVRFRRGEATIELDLAYDAPGLGPPAPPQLVAPAAPPDDEAAPDDGSNEPPQPAANQ